MAMTALLLLANGAALLFARRNEPVPGEIRFTRWLGTGPGSASAREWGDWLTDQTAPALFAVIAALAVARWRLRGAAVMAGAAICTVLVRWTDLAPRSRPSLGGRWGLPVEGWGGYPSGHVVFVGVVLGALVLLSWTSGTDQPQEGAHRRARPWTMALLALTVTVVTMWSRIASLTHWAFDAVGGLLVAALILVLLTPLATWQSAAIQQ